MQVLPRDRSPMTTCVRCTKPMPDQAYACTRCGITRPRGWLEEIADMVVAARDIAYGQARTGAGGHGQPGARIELDFGAQARLDAVENQLGTWVRHVLEERGSP